MRRAGTDQRPIVRVEGVDYRDAARGAARQRADDRPAQRCRRSLRASGGRTNWQGCASPTASAQLGRVVRMIELPTCEALRSRARRRRRNHRPAGPRRDPQLDVRGGAVEVDARLPARGLQPIARSTSSRSFPTGSPGCASQRHVRNALAAGSEDRVVNIRDHDAARRRPGRRHPVRRRRRDGAARRRARRARCAPATAATR